MAFAPRTAEEARRILDEGGSYDRGVWSRGGGGLAGPAAPAPTIPPSAVSTITGVDPSALAATLYDKELPLFLGGMAAIGGRIIEGPVYGNVGGSPTASWIVLYAYNANYEANGIAIRELRFRGKRAWTLAGGVLMSGLTVGGATVGTNQTVRFNTGSLTQLPDAWSTSRFAARANAYRSGITATFENIKLDQFGGEPIIPHTTTVAADSTFGDPEDGIAWADALPVLARYAGLEDDEFEGVDLTGAVPALFVAKKQQFIEWINDHRAVRPYWSIRLKDKLYVVEKANTSIDLTVDRTMVLKSGGEPFAFTIAGPAEMARKKNLTFVNVDRDYDLDTVSAQLETNPVPATTGFDEESIELADVMTSDVATALVNYALFNQDLEREQGEMTGKRALYGIEAGDQLKITTEFKNFYHRVDEVVRSPGCSAEIKTMGMLTCAVENEAGAAVSAGRNGDGELGIGAAGADQTSFAAMGAFTDWDMVSAGGFHAAGIRGGLAYTWGDGGAGRLGHGNTTDQPSPTQVGVATNWVSVACASARTFLINEAGELWGCGDNSFGRLGDNTTTNRLSPVQLGTDTDWAWVRCGENHAVAGKTNGKIYVWGSNGNGQLGLADTTDRDEPTQLGSDTNWAEAACGARHTLLRKAIGTIYACGDNGEGQLGLGDIVERTSPVQIGSSSDWTQLAAGFKFSLALRGGGLAYSWGDGLNGKTGHGDTTDRTSPTSLGADLWRVVRAAGGAQLGGHWFGIRLNGDLYGCGRNDRGQLGLADTTDRQTPTLVNSSNDWVDAACGENFTIAIKES